MLEKQRAAGFRKDKVKEEKTGKSSTQKKPKRISSKWLRNISYKNVNVQIAFSLILFFSQNSIHYLGSWKYA